MTGLDWVLESGLEVVKVTDLIYAKQSMGTVKWVLAVPEDSGFQRLEDLDGRQRAVQKAAEFRDGLMAERGGADRLSLLRKSMIGTIAVLNCMVEDGLTRWLAGKEVDHAALLSLINARRREAELIGIDPDPKDARDVTTLQSYLKAKETKT